MKLARVAFVALCLLIICCWGLGALAEEPGTAPSDDEACATGEQPQDMLEPEEGDTTAPPDETEPDAAAAQHTPPLGGAAATQSADALATPIPTTSPREAVLPFMGSDPAPDFTLPSLDGTEVSLSDYLGKVVVVSFWSAWDKDSMREVSLLSQAAERNADIVLITVSDVARAYENEPVSEQNIVEVRQWMESYARENDYKFPILMDANGSVTGSATYNASTLPHTCFIDRDGILRINWRGTLSEQSLETLLEMMYALDD